MEDIKTELLSRVGPCFWRLYAEDAAAGRFMAVLSDDQGSTKCFLPVTAQSLQGRMSYLSEQWARARLDEVRRGPSPRPADLEWKSASWRKD